MLDPISHLKVRVTDTKRKRALMKFWRVTRKALIEWVTCQGIRRGEQTTTDFYRRTLGYSLGINDEDVLGGRRHYARCNPSMIRSHPLRHVPEGLCIKTHEGILEEVLAKTLYG